MHTYEESIHAENGVGTRGLPAYVVLDTSGSMSPYEELLNETLTEIVDTLYSSPKVSDFIHLSILSFNSNPYVVLEMTEISQLTELPAVSCGGTTNYGPMFQLLRKQISQDVPSLSAKGVRVFRPVVFVLTDGIPTDRPSSSWHGPLDALIDSNWPWHPNVITYGFGDAREEILKRVSTLAAYIADKDQRDNTRKALATALNSLLHSLVASAQAQRLLVPEEVNGFKSVPMDFIEG